MSKVLVITGSYNKNGNTSKLAESFIKGAEESGNEVKRIDAAFLNLKDCNGCNNCWKNNNACVIDDDFNKIEKYLETYDTLVFSAPLYWANLPANIRMIIDKLYAYGGTGGPRPLTIKRIYLMVSGGGGEETNEYKPLLDEFKLITDHLGIENKDTIIAGDLRKVGGIEKTDYLEKAYNLGKEI